MTWRAIRSLTHYVDQAFARGRGLKRLERRPILLVVGKPGPSRQAHVKQVWGFMGVRAHVLDQDPFHMGLTRRAWFSDNK